MEKREYMPWIRADETRAFATDREVYQYDRQVFANNLGWLLSQTREGIIGCEMQDHYVIVKFRNCEKKIDVSCDSYLGIIKDVLSHI